MNKIKGKNILLITPKFLGYEKYIKKSIEASKANVYMIYENMKDINILYQSAFFVAFQLYKKMIENHYRHFIKSLPEKIDIIFIIRGESISDKILRELKAKYQNAKVIMYQWDSVKNNPNATLIAKYCDEVYTFDSEDAKKYFWKYRPLFYLRELRQECRKKKHDFAYICLLHSDRFAVFKKIKQLVDDNNMIMYHHLYTYKLGYYINKYILRKEQYQKYVDSEMKFITLSLEKTNEIYSESKIIVDYAHPQQTGLTMRTIECVGHKCKLITNNIKIKESDIYHPNNVYVYSLENFEIPLEFLNSPYVEMEEEKYYYYSLEGWLSTIFE